MTEADWLSSTDPQAMLTFLRDSGNLSERKARLFAVACCRRIWHLLVHEVSREAVEVAERFADGNASKEELAAARERAGAAIDQHGNGVTAVDAAFERASDAARYTPASAAHSECFSRIASFSRSAINAANEAARKGQCPILRCIVGNPFRPPPPTDPSVLQWQGGTIVRLARAAYEERELPSGLLNGHLLAVLADTVEEAGADTDLVAHLRGPGPHVRGCHVLDLILGRS